MEYIETPMVLFVPYCEVYSSFIVQCLESISRQSYSKYSVLIVNDGAKHTDHVQTYILGKSNFTLIHRQDNGGPAASKWTFLEYIQNNVTKYSVNDIVMIIDGDDYLVDDKVFTTINDTYHQSKCWMTYGTAIGKWCGNGIPIPTEWKNIRSERWIYDHPRTFKLAFALTFQENDFRMNGKWLTKGTDRPIVYNCVEMSGKERCVFIPRKLYYYVEHPQNSYKTVHVKEKKEQIYYLSNITPKETIVEDIHIVMCYFRRPENLEIQMMNLNLQTVANRIHLHLLNNNTETVAILDKSLRELRTKYTNIQVTLTHYNNEFFGFQRFFYIRDVLLKKYNIDYAIMMDDDNTFPHNWVENMYKLRQPKTYTTWFGRRWDDTNLDYWSGSLVQTHECRWGVKEHIREFHYGGTCGCIIDVNIFRDGSKLWDIPSDLPEGTTVYNIEDLWLSFVIRKLYGWNIKRSFLPDVGTIEHLTKAHKTALWKTLVQPKQNLLVYLVNKYGL